jgi:hypothetical protein
MEGGLYSVVDAVSSSGASYTPIGIVPTDSGQAASTTPAVQQQVPPPRGSVPAPADAKGLTVVPDFTSGLAGSYVIDYRDPDTDQVVVQVPMRTAFAGFADANSAATKVGKTLDTEA